MVSARVVTAELLTVELASAASSAVLPVARAATVTEPLVVEVAEMVTFLAAVICELPPTDTVAFEPTLIEPTFACCVALKIPVEVAVRLEVAVKLTSVPCKDAPVMEIAAVAVRLTPVPESVPLSVSEAASVRSPEVASSEAPAFTATDSAAMLIELAAYWPFNVSSESAEAVKVPPRVIAYRSRPTGWPLSCPAHRSR